MSTENLNLLLATVAVVLTAVAVIVAIKTLGYMRGRDLEMDTRSGWIEIHKAMINLRVQREFVMSELGMVHVSKSGGLDQGIKDYTLASTQLRSQLDRLNDEPLIVELAGFLDANVLTAKWQTEAFQKAFDGFVHKVAFKARPK
jgi:hypothetical protein